MPASAALLGFRGVRVRALKRKGAREVLALWRRRSDPNPLLGDVEAAVASILEGVARRAAAAVMGA